MCSPRDQFKLSLLVSLVQNSPEILDHSLSGGDVQSCPQVAVVVADTQVALRIHLSPPPICPAHMPLDRQDRPFCPCHTCRGNLDGSHTSCFIN